MKIKKKESSIPLGARARYVSYIRLGMAIEQLDYILKTALVDTISKVELAEARKLIENEEQMIYDKLKKKGYI